MLPIIVFISPYKVCGTVFSVQYLCTIPTFFILIFEKDALLNHPYKEIKYEKTRFACLFNFRYDYSRILLKADCSRKEKQNR